VSVQNYANHVKWVPLFHFFLLPVFTINFAWSLYHLKKTGFSLHAAGYVLLAAAFIVQLLLQRTFALRVQDRVIRLEEQLRYQRVLPADLQARATAFTIGQIVSLRFASDAELPALARKVLDEKLQDRKTIKQSIKNWKADELRA
jgi:phosphoglycerol transferase MdoB-like AlkP superfamily enzyme